MYPRFDKTDHWLRLIIMVFFLVTIVGAHHEINAPIMCVVRTTVRCSSTVKTSKRLKCHPFGIYRVQIMTAFHLSSESKMFESQQADEWMCYLLPVCFIEYFDVCWATWFLKQVQKSGNIIWTLLIKFIRCDLPHLINIQGTVQIYRVHVRFSSNKSSHATNKDNQVERFKPNILSTEKKTPSFANKA